MIKNYKNILQYIFLIIFIIYLISRISLILLVGSYYGIFYVAIVLMASFILISGLKINIINELFILLLIWMSVILIFNILIIDRVVDSLGRSQIDLMINVIGNIAVFFFSGYLFYYLNIYQYIVSYKSIFKIIYFSNFGIFLLFLENWKVSYGLISERMMEGWVSHLDFGSTIILLSYLVISFYNGFLRISMIAFASFFLYILDGRSALILFISSIVFLWVIKILRYKIKNILLFLILSGILLFLLMNILFMEDPSFLERIKIFSLGFDYIDEQLYFGNPSLILEYYEDYGGYFHNALSMIQFYGIIPFLLVILMCGIILSRLFLKLKSCDKSSELYFISHLFFYGISSLIFSKSVSESVAWFSIGMSSALLYSHRICNIKPLEKI